MKNPEYYAVFRGRVMQPTIFSTWADVHPRVTEYPGSLHESFPSLDAARAWLRQQQAVADQAGRPPLDDFRKLHGEAAARQRKKNFYAVANGKHAGVYTSWSDCRPYVEGVTDACCEGFATHADAEAFIEYWKQTVAEVYRMEMKKALDAGLRPRTMNFNIAELLSRDDA